MYLLQRLRKRIEVVSVAQPYHGLQLPKLIVLIDLKRVV
jgi:hypothetical protein